MPRKLSWQLIALLGGMIILGGIIPRPLRQFWAIWGTMLILCRRAPLRELLILLPSSRTSSIGLLSSHTTTMKSTRGLRTNVPRIMFVVGGAHILLTFYLSSTPRHLQLLVRTRLYLIGGILPRKLQRFPTTPLDWDWRNFLFLQNGSSLFGGYCFDQRWTTFG